MQNLLNDLTDLLKKDERFVAEGKLLKNPIIEAALQLDPALLKLLLSNKTMKNHFFRDVEGVLVFDKIEFQKFVSNKSFLKDSYTAFSNKIGLTSDDEFISESKDVVLSWPHKDCVLEGGQTKEDEKRDEIFWNETLAPDEIDRLLSPKVLTSFKKYDSKGEHKVNDISLEDNLIIKGNNLLALHSLLPVYRGRIKLNYIDPPFNTESAANTFSYNNSFNHSTWLTFMRNRIIVAKQLLTEDGLFIISIDHNELFYLGLLCDELLGRENRIGIVAIETNPRGRSDSKFFATSSEYLLVYAKNPLVASIGDFPLTDEQIEDFNLEDEISKYRLLPFRRSGSNSTPKERPNLFYPIYFDEKTNYIGLEPKKDSIKVIPVDTDGQKRVWRHSKESFIEAVENGDVIIKRNSGDTLTVKLKDRIKEGRKPKTIWTNPLYDASSHGTNLIKKIFGEKVFSYPKSVHLMKDILRITTNKNDLIMDFFGGSGTTAQAVWNLNEEDGGSRKFITCEQMEYVDNVTKERLRLYLDRNNRASSFTYFELTKLNQNFVDQITKSKTTKELKLIWETIKKYGFISYKVNPQEIDKNISEFEELSIADQKKFLIEVLDKNHLYVNYSEIDDKDYKISEEDKKLNKKFYSLK